MSDKLNISLDVLFSRMEKFITTKTVVGEPIKMDGVIIIPLIDVSFGVGAGAIDSDKEKDKKEQSGGGMGGKISPSAVLVVVDGNVSLVNIKNQDSLNKLIDLAPGIISKLNLGSLFKKKDKDKDKDETQAPAPEETMEDDEITIKQTVINEVEQ